MKISSLSALFLIGLCIIGLCSCKKSTKPAPPPANIVNPKTAVAVCDYDVNDTTLTNHGWTETFDDEFTGDLSNWYAYTGGEEFSGVYEQQCYEPANAQIVNGVLEITAMQQTVTGPDTIHSTTQKSFNYTSASIVSNQTFSANSTTPKVRIVARVKIASGYGMASLFESYGINWPTNGQINFFQVEGNDLQEYETDYFYGTQLSQNLVNNAMVYDPVNQDLSTCWHVFMTEWTQNSLNYYLDGQLVETKTAGGYIPSLFGKSENISLSLPIGGLYYTNLVPANIQVGTLYVDYVKVFTSN